MFLDAFRLRYFFNPAKLTASDAKELECGDGKDPECGQVPQQVGRQ